MSPLDLILRPSPNVLAQMRRHPMLKHYRTKQREYLQWRSEQEEKQGKPCYFPPYLRKLRNEWFEERYEKYRRGGQNEKIDLGQEPQEYEFAPNDIDESEAFGYKVWRWLNHCRDEDESGQPSGRAAI